MSSGGGRGLWMKYLRTKGEYTEVDHDHFRDERLRDGEDALATRDTHKRTWKELAVIVLFSLGALAFLWLLLTWNP